MKSTKTITILGESVLPGESKTIDMEIAKLHNTAKLKIVIVFVLLIFNKKAKCKDYYLEFVNLKSFQLITSNKYSRKCGLKLALRLCEIVLKCKTQH